MSLEGFYNELTVDKPKLVWAKKLTKVMGVTKKSYKSVCSFIKTHDAVEGEQQEIDYISCLYGRMGRDWWTQERYVTMHKLPSGYFIPVDVFNILLKSGNNITLL